MIIDATKIDYFQNPPRSYYDEFVSIFKTNVVRKKLKIAPKKPIAQTKKNQKGTSVHE